MHPIQSQWTPGFSTTIFVYATHISPFPTTPPIPSSLIAPSTLTRASTGWLAESSNSALDEINCQRSCQLLLSTVITTHRAALEPRKSEYKSLPTYHLQVAKYLQHIYPLPLLKVPAHTSPTTTLPLSSNKGCRHGFSLSKDSGMRVGKKTGGENHGIDIHQVRVE
jgi:hypothetical protein